MEGKPGACFCKDLSRKDGLRSICRECRSSERRVPKKPKEDLPEGTKRCTKCLDIKDVSLFSKSKYTRDNLNPRCKACVRIMNAEAHRKNPHRKRKKTALRKSTSRRIRRRKPVPYDPVRAAAKYQRSKVKVAAYWKAHAKERNAYQVLRRQTNVQSRLYKSLNGRMNFGSQGTLQIFIHSKSYRLLTPAIKSAS